MRHLFLDMDGVLVDFDGEVLRRTGKAWHDMSKEERTIFWETFDPSFFVTAAPLRNFELLLWFGLKHFDSVRLLTALPYYRKDLALQCMEAKMEWAHKHVGKHVPITFGPYAIDKQRHCCGTLKSVLVDDNRHNVEQWNNRGSYAILHDLKHNDTMYWLNRYVESEI